MKFVFNARSSESPFVEKIWHTQSEGTGTFTSTAASNWEIVINKLRGQTSIVVRGPETKATPADVTEPEGEFFGIIFKVGTFMPLLPPGNQIDRNDLTLPDASSQSFWLHGSAWEFPTFENADTFVNRLVREGLLVRDNIVDGVLQDQPQYASIRTVRRRFLQVTGLTHSTIQQIERANHALTLLRKGKSILDTVFEAGYFDQPHLTKSLKHFVGKTPAQILRANEPE
jgi:hypothetical protein